MPPSIVDGMHLLLPASFFSSDTFGPLRQDQPVWMALACLKSYFQSIALYEQKSAPSPQAFLKNPEQIAIGEGTVIEAGAFIEGPCILGNNCHIRHGATLRGGVLCGDGCVIGHAAEVKHSILLDRAHVAHLNYVGDSILGSDVNLGAGVKCANLRLDRKAVRLHVKGEIIETGLKKMGAILGDGCQIGCNSVLNPGTLMGRGCIAHPLLHLGGIFEAGSRMKENASERTDGLRF